MTLPGTSQSSRLLNLCSSTHLHLHPPRVVSIRMPESFTFRQTQAAQAAHTFMKKLIEWYTSNLHN